MFKKLSLLISLVLFSQQMIAKSQCNSIDVTSKNTIDVPWSFSLHEEKAPELCHYSKTKSHNEDVDFTAIYYLDLSVVIEYLSRGFILPVPGPVDPDTYEPAPSPSIPFSQWSDKGVKSWIVGMDIAFLDAYGNTLFHVQKTQMADSSSNGFQVVDWKIDLSEKTEYVEKINKVVLTPNFNRLPPKFISTSMMCVNDLSEAGIRNYTDAICRHMSGNVLFELSPVYECSCKVVGSGYEVGGKECQILDCDLDMPSIVSENPLLTQDQADDVSELCDNYDCDALCDKFPQIGFCQ